ncbi:hypothetical protein DSECCO2_523080 [anaerobic digester metagenome]
MAPRWSTSADVASAVLTATAVISLALAVLREISSMVALISSDAAATVEMLTEACSVAAATERMFVLISSDAAATASERV